MKTIHDRILIFLSISSLCACLFTSCREKNDPSDDDVNLMGIVRFHLHTYIEDNEVDLYNIPYTTHAGRTISLSMAQLYISNVQLVKLDGSTYDIANNKILKTLATDTYLIGEAPVGNYKSIRFKVGLDPTVNIPDLSAPADSAMWFSKTNTAEGYVFMNVQGKVDTSDAMSEPLVPFVYKIGTNVNYKQVNMPDKNFTVTAGEVFYAHLLADYSRLFNGIKLNENSNLFIKTAADNSSSVAQKIVNNIPAMFRYEQ